MNSLIKNIGHTCLNVALCLSSLSAVAATTSYYRTRKGSYKNYQQAAQDAMRHQTPKIRPIKFITQQDFNLEMPSEPELTKGQKIRELVIVDNQVENKEILYKQQNPGVEFVEIRNDGDGVTQLFEILTKYNSLESVHIFSHARSGELQLGGQLLDKRALESNLQLFNALNGAIKQGGDLLFYGCELAKGDRGEELLQLIKGNSHVDIAASDDLTGNRVDADWELEIKKGNIETTPLPESIALKDFTGVLQSEITFGFEDLTGIYTNSDTSVVSVYGDYSLQVISDQPFYLYNHVGNQSGDRAIGAYYTDNTYFDLSLIDENFILNSFSVGFNYGNTSRNYQAVIYYADGSVDNSLLFTVPDGSTTINVNASYNLIEKFRIKRADGGNMLMSIDDVKLTPLATPEAPNPDQPVQTVSTIATTYTISQADYAEVGNTISVYKDADEDGEIDSGELVEVTTVAADGSWSFDVGLDTDTDNYFLLQATDASYDWNDSEVIVLPTINQSSSPFPVLDEFDETAIYESSAFEFSQSDYSVVGATITLYEDEDDDGILDPEDDVLETTTVAADGSWSIVPVLNSGIQNHFLLQAGSSTLVDVPSISVSADGSYMAFKLCGDYIIGSSANADLTSISQATDLLKLAEASCDLNFQLEAGTYSGDIDIDNLANGDYWVSFIGADQAGTIIQPTTNGMDKTGFASLGTSKVGIYISSSSNIRLSNFTLDLDVFASSPVSIAVNEAVAIGLKDVENLVLEKLIVSSTAFPTQVSVGGNIVESCEVVSTVGIRNSANITIDQNQFSGAAFHINTYYHPTYYTTNTIDSLTITNNTFTDYMTANYLRGSSVANVTINGNTYEDTWLLTDGVFYPEGEIYLHSINYDGTETYSLTDNIIFSDTDENGAENFGVFTDFDQNVGDSYVASGNTIEGRYYGMITGGISNSTITSNEITSSGRALSITRETGKLTVQNNLLLAEETALLINSAVEDFYLIHNTLKSNNATALSVTGSIDGESALVNNIISGSGDDLYISSLTPISLTYDYNAYANGALSIDDYNGNSISSLADWQSAGFDANSQTVSDTFVASEDLRLADAGTYRFGVYVDTVATDFEEDTRYDDGTIDVGADQYYQTGDFCGQYIVGSSGTADFDSFDLLVSNLRNASFSCDVEILIENGTYSEAIDLSGFDMGDYSLTVRGESKENVLLNPTGNVEQAAISVAVDQITFRDFTLEVEESSGASRGIDVVSSVKFSMSNLDITIHQETLNGDKAKGLYLQVGTDISLDSITFSGGYNNVRSKQYAAFGQVSITNSEFGNSAWSQVRLYKSSAELVAVENNHFGTLSSENSIPQLYLVGDFDTNPVSDASLWYDSVYIANNYHFNDNGKLTSKAIHVEYTQKALIERNYVDAYGYHIYLKDVNDAVVRKNELFNSYYRTIYHPGALSNTSKVSVTNNIVQSFSAEALYVKDVDYIIIHNNTLIGEEVLFVAYLQPFRSIEFHNNIIASRAELESAPVYSQSLVTFKWIGSSTSMELVSIDNNLYSATSDYGYTFSYSGRDILPFDDGDFATLSDWQTHQQILDQNSQSFVADFSDDFRLKNSTDYRFGVYIDGIDEDIDGETRSATFGIDVGADQYCGDVSGSLTIESCDSYDWEGTTYTQSGTYTETFTNVSGCDSTATLYLTIIADGICWQSAAWSNGSGPTSSENAYILDDYSTANDGSLVVQDLTISTGNTLYIDDETLVDVSGDLQNDGDLVVNSGGSLLTYDGYTHGGNDIFVKRNTRYAGGRYSMVGSPMQQSNEIKGDLLGQHVYQYDETVAYDVSNAGLHKWIYASSEELIPGRGYTQANQQEIIFEGSPNVGTVVYSGTYTSDDGTHEGYNLVSNPYPAALDVADFLLANSNIEGAIYLWDDNGSDTQRGTNSDYIVANGIAATNTTAAGGETRYNTAVGTAQGFFVKIISAANTDITFTEGMRLEDSNSDDNFFRSTDTPITRINLTNDEGLFKQTVLAWKEEASTTELIRVYDASVFNLTDHNLLYTEKANQALAINVQPIDWREVSLGLNVSVAGEYKLSMEGEEQIYLRDHLTDQTVDLSLGSYEFTANTTGQITNRFSLLPGIETPLGVETAVSKVYSRGHLIEVKLSSSEERTYDVYNLDGRLLISSTIRGNGSIDAHDLKDGLYLVHDGQQTHKVILK